jgi:translation initiation factor 2B subunit (eIF-2B alpha/beta/delta family)
MVAMMLKAQGVPVVCCCETYKFSERVMLDSIVGNEMGLLDFIISSRPFPRSRLIHDIYDAIDSITSQSLARTDDSTA